MSENAPYEPDMRAHMDPEPWATGLLMGLEDRGYGELDRGFANVLHEEACELASKLLANEEAADQRIAELERQVKDLLAENAEAKALLGEVEVLGPGLNIDANVADVPDGWTDRRDALLNPTPEPKETT